MRDFDFAKLRALRREEKVRAKAVAAQAEVHASTITRLEAGKGDLSESLLEAYALCLGTTPSELLAKIGVERSFPLYAQLITLATGPIWGLPSDDTERSGGSNRERLRADCAVGAQHVRELLVRFVLAGTHEARRLHLVLQLEPYHDDGLYMALAKALKRNCPVIYASGEEILRQLDGSHSQ